MSKLLEDKLDECIRIAEMEQDLGTQAVLLSLPGAICSGQQNLLSTNVQKFVREVLIANIESGKAQLN